MRIDKLSKLLYETPLTLERARNIITIYNIRVTSNPKEIDEICISDLDRIIEDFDMIVDVYELRGVKGKSNYNLNLQKDCSTELEKIKIKLKPSSLSLPFTIENLVEYLRKYKIELNFEPTLIKHNFKTYWK